jgi:hypothetical protein
VTLPNGTDAAPFVKAATRDTKAYMKSKGGRYIPIGYSAADIATIRPMFQNYLVCGPLNETIDFFAVNIYEWVLPTFRSRLILVRRIVLRNIRLRRPSRRIPKLSCTHIFLRRRLYNNPSPYIHRYGCNLWSRHGRRPLRNHCLRMDPRSQ